MGAGMADRKREPGNRCTQAIKYWPRLKKGQYRRLEGRGGNCECINTASVARLHAEGVRRGLIDSLLRRDNCQADELTGPNQVLRQSPGMPCNAAWAASGQRQRKLDCTAKASIWGLTFCR